MTTDTSPNSGNKTDVRTDGSYLKASDGVASPYQAPAKQYNAGGGVINPYNNVTATPVGVINSAQLAPVKEYKLPNNKADTTAATLQGTIAGGNETVKQNAAQAAAAEQAQNSDGGLIQKMREDIMGINNEIGGAASTIDRTAENAQKQTAIQQSNNIAAEQQALRDKLEALDKNPNGLFGGALQEEKDRITRDSVNIQTKYAVIQNAAAQNYQALAEVNQQALDNKLAPLKTKLENLRFFYEENKADFDKKDDRLYAEKLRQEERDYNKVATAEKLLSDTKLMGIKSAAEQSAPASVIAAINNAETPAAAIIAAGKYGGDMLARTIKLQTISKNNMEMDKLAQEIKKSKAELAVPTVAGSTLSTNQIMLNSAKNDKFADQATKDKISKSGLIIDQLGALESTIAKQNSTGFVTGRTAKLLSTIGLNADAGLVQAQLTALVPQLARGTYGEVGVLTKEDTVNYRNTLPNLTSDKDKNDLVLAMTLNVVGKALKNTLETEATNGVNMSGNVQKYNQIMAKKNEIEDRVGVTKQKLFALGAANPQYAPMIKELLATGEKPSAILEALGATD